MICAARVVRRTKLREKDWVLRGTKDSAVRTSLLTLLALTALALAGGSTAAPAPTLGPVGFLVGATEDGVQGLDDGGAAIYTQMTTHGLGAIRMSVDYEPAQ